MSDIWPTREIFAIRLSRLTAMNILDNHSFESEVNEMNLNIAVIEDDPLRLIGLRSILEEVAGFHLAAMSVAELAVECTVDLVLLGIGSGIKSFETLAHIRTARREVPVLVTGTNATEETIIRALGYGAKGYVDEAAPATHLAEAISAVHRGLIWAPRRVLSIFIDRSLEMSGRDVRPGASRLTAREKQVLQMQSITP